MESRVQKPRYKSNKKEVDEAEEEGNGYIKRNGNGSCGGNCDVVVANGGAIGGGCRGLQAGRLWVLRWWLVKVNCAA